MNTIAKLIIGIIMASTVGTGGVVLWKMKDTKSTSTSTSPNVETASVPTETG